MDCTVTFNSGGYLRHPYEVSRDRSALSRRAWEREQAFKEDVVTYRQDKERWLDEASAHGVLEDARARLGAMAPDPLRPAPKASQAPELRWPEAQAPLGGQRIQVGNMALFADDFAYLGVTAQMLRELDGAVCVAHNSIVVHVPQEVRGIFGKTAKTAPKPPNNDMAFSAWATKPWTLRERGEAWVAELGAQAFSDLAAEQHLDMHISAGNDHYRLTYPSDDGERQLFRHHFRGAPLPAQLLPPLPGAADAAAGASSAGGAPSRRVLIGAQDLLRRAGVDDTTMAKLEARIAALGV